MAERFTTPVGRLVQGDAFTPQTKDQQGNPRVVKTGPNAGQPNPQFYIGVAFRKDDPNWPMFWALLDRVARQEFPTLFPTPGGPCINPKFTFKVLDGDGFDTNGKDNKLKEGFAGHFVVRFASSFQPKVFHVGRYNPQDQVMTPQELRRGYYVRVNGSVAGNNNGQNPGLYVNLDMIEIAGYGPEIVTGPDANEAFGAHPAQLPPGASATPLAPPAGMAPAVQPGQPGYPGNPAQAYGAPPPGPGGYAHPANPYAPGPVPQPPAPGIPQTYNPPGPPGGAYVPPGMAPPGAGYPGSAPGAAPPGGAGTFTGAPNGAYPYNPPQPGPPGGPPPVGYTAPGAPGAGPPSVGPGAPGMPYPGSPPAPPAPYGGYMQPPPRVMLPSAGSTPYEQWIVAGWSDAQLVQAGHMAP